MTVKPSTTGEKLLVTLENVARHQPIGVSELSRILHFDKSTVQRMLVTLHNTGWICPGTNQKTTKWCVTDRLALLADISRDTRDIREKARATLESIRDRSGESVSLVVEEASHFRVIDVAESEQTLRVVPRVGQDVPGPVSASALAFLCHLPPAQHTRLLGKKPGREVNALIAVTSDAGFAVRESTRGGGTVSVASAVRDTTGNPIAAIVVSAPIDRLVTAKERNAIGNLVRKAADRLSDE